MSNTPLLKADDDFNQRAMSISVFASLFFLSALLAGSVGLFVFFSLVIFSHARFAIDPMGKHGVADGGVSRLGGIAIVIGLIFWHFVSVVMGDSILYFRSLQLSHYGFLIGTFALCIAFVGLLDDLKQSLSPQIRILIMLVISSLGFFLHSELLPNTSPLIGFIDIFDDPMPLFLGSVFVLIGFINAGNMVDGANGLLSIIALSFFTFSFIQTESVDYLILSLAIGVFSVVNLVWGQIILGDFGAYLLSALITLSCFHMYNEIDISVWVFACMLSYPCFEIVRVIGMRIIKNKSPFLADNEHVHNRLHSFFLSKGFSSVHSNSLTGLCISLLSCLIPNILFYSEYLSISSRSWFAVFVVQCIVFSLLNIGLRFWRTDARIYGQS